MRRCYWIAFLLPALVLAGGLFARADETNLVADPSFEIPRERDQFGHVFARWGGWKYEGDCEFRVGDIARTGQHSCLLYGGMGAKIRMAQTVDLEPGRYRITAYIRGLDIGTGTWNMTTEFMFNDKYIPLGKNGTFGWTKLTYVGEVQEKKQAGPSFGLMAPGYFWIDDVSLTRVGNDVPLTDKPVLGPDEAPIEPPATLGASAVRCPECGYKNPPSGGRCYACGAKLGSKTTAAAGPKVKTITSFEEEKSLFDGGTVVASHATDGRRALRIDRSYVVMSRPQNWLGYDYLEADIDTESTVPIPLAVEIRDTETRDYWTRVNYTTVVPPGKSTLTIPIKQLYVGEKSRPGRMLNLSGITQFVLSIDDKPPAPLFVDNLRLVRDDSLDKVRFDGLFAFDFGTNTSPVMEGFTPITPGTLYSKGRGYGLKDARVWRAFDALQPEPLYQDFLCIEAGGLAVDVPNGKYRVFVNIDSPSGFWGEYQVYRQRDPQGRGPAGGEAKPWTSRRSRRSTYRFWNVDDRPGENVFDKYQKPYFSEKTFDVTVTDGQLNLEFQGENWACSVSAVIIFPVAKAGQGEAFLKFVESKRRFYFDNASSASCTAPPATRSSPRPPTSAGVMWSSSPTSCATSSTMTLPQPAEIASTAARRGLRGRVRAGDTRPGTLEGPGPRDGDARRSDRPGRHDPRAGRSRSARSATASAASRWKARSTRSARGSSCRAEVAEVPKGVTRSFWLTVKTPDDGQARRLSRAAPPSRRRRPRRKSRWNSASARARSIRWTSPPARSAARSTSPGTATTRPPPPSTARSTRACLQRLREYGFTSCSGLPAIPYRGFKDGQPILDFSQADAQMKHAKDLGFLAVGTYGSGVSGFDPYHQDTGADERRRVQGLHGVPQGGLSARSSVTPRAKAGCRSITTWPTNRSATS